MLLTAAALGVVSLGLIAFLIPWGSLPRDLPMQPAENDFTAAQIAAGHSFGGAMRLLGVAGMLIGLAVVLLLALRWERIASRLPGGEVTKVALSAVIIMMIASLARLPFSMRREVLARREGLSTSTWASWSIDQLKSLAVSLSTVTAVLIVICLIVRAFPRHWWILLASGAALLTIVFSLFFPVLIEPLFNRFTPMPAGQLRSEIFDLARQEQVPIREVLVADASRRTTALNAYVSGIGPTRRVVVYDTLLREAPAAEVRMVVAHELAHAGERDVWTSTLIGAVGAAFAIVLIGLLLGPRIGQAAGVGSLIAAVMILSLIQQPLVSAMSRQVEARADRHALAATADPQTFAQMQRRLALTNRADLIAPRWAYLLFATHPSTRERIALARWWAAREGVALPGPLRDQP